MGNYKKQTTARKDSLRDSNANTAGPSQGQRRTSNRTSSGSRTDSQQISHPCGKCNSSVRDGQDGLHCDGCFKWYHLGCTSVSSQKYQVISVNTGIDDGIMWNCDDCRKDDGQSFAALRKTIMDLTTVVDDLRNELKKSKSFEESFEQKVKEIINEEKEKDKRRDNVIIHGLEEAPDETGDVENVSEIVAKVDDDQAVVEVMRLGKKEPGKIRPIKVVFRSGSGIKNKLFKLKQNSQLDQKFSNLKFVSDRTKQEREELKALYSKLNARKEAGEKDLVIRNMKIVKIGPSLNDGSGPSGSSSKRD